MRVFVYGTLKEGYGNNRLLRDHELVGPGVIENYKLVEHSRGSIPFAVPHNGSSIKGEIWDIGDNQGTLRSLDSLEGHPHGYLRVTERTTEGEQVEVYTMPSDRLRARELPDVPLNADNQHEWVRPEWTR